MEIQDVLTLDIFSCPKLLRSVRSVRLSKVNYGSEHKPWIAAGQPKWYCLFLMCVLHGQLPQYNIHSSCHALSIYHWAIPQSLLPHSIQDECAQSNTQHTYICQCHWYGQGYDGFLRLPNPRTHPEGRHHGCQTLQLATQQGQSSWISEGFYGRIGTLHWYCNRYSDVWVGMPDVTTVIKFDTFLPPEILPFSTLKQCIGRAGRRGQPCTAITYAPPWVFNPPSSIDVDMKRSSKRRKDTKSYHSLFDAGTILPSSCAPVTLTLCTKAKPHFPMPPTASALSIRVTHHWNLIMRWYDFGPRCLRRRYAQGVCRRCRGCDWMGCFSYLAQPSRHHWQNNSVCEHSRHGQPIINRVHGISWEWVARYSSRGASLIRYHHVDFFRRRMGINGASSEDNIRPPPSSAKTDVKGHRE